jgi:hypothetical protein
MPGQSQLLGVLCATCLLQGSMRLDQQAEQLLLSLFDGAAWEFERWKQQNPQGYISQVRAVWTGLQLMLSIALNW